MSCGIFRWARVSRFQFVHIFFVFSLFMTNFSSMETPLLVGNSFTNAHKDWKEGMYENFKE